MRCLGCWCGVGGVGSQNWWVSSIRPDIQYAVKEVSRGLTSPTEDREAKVKMILRYLAGSKDCVFTLRPRVKLRPEMSSLDVVAYIDVFS